MKKDLYVSEIVKTISESLEKIRCKKPTFLHEPYFKNTKASEYVNDCLETGWVSSAGKWVNKFEDTIKEFTSARNVIAISNGTDALRLSLYLLGVSHNDEVLIPPLSFVATANSVSHLGAHPHFIDIENESFGMDPILLRKYLEEIAIQKEGKTINKRTSREIKAVIVVHVFGLPAKTEELKLVCDKWNLALLEDAAEALGSFDLIHSNKVHCGLTGQLGTLSFNGNKLITTGGGGAVLTNNDYLANRARHLSTTAKLDHPWEFEHDEVGWNDRLPNINAALGCAQLEEIKIRLEKKNKLYQIYKEGFKNMENISLLNTRENTITNNWLISFLLTGLEEKQYKNYRDQIISELHSKGIYVRPSWNLLSSLKMYKDSPKSSLKVAKNYQHRIINLPSSPQLIP